MNDLDAIYNEVVQLEDFDSYTPYQQRCDKILQMIDDFKKNNTIVDYHLICKLFNELHKEEKQLEDFFTSIMEHEQWVSKYKWLVKAGFEVTLKVLLQEIDKQNGTD